MASTAGNGNPLARAAASYLLPSAGVALALLLALGLTTLVQLPNAAMLFLLSILFAAVQLGFGPALLATALSFLSYNFFFIEPRYTFSVAQPHELLSLFVFLAVAVLTSAIAGRARGEAASAERRARASDRLYEFARRLSGLADPQSVLDGAAIQVHGDLRRQAVILVPESGRLAVSAAWPRRTRSTATPLMPRATLIYTVSQRAPGPDMRRKRPGSSCRCGHRKDLSASSGSRSLAPPRRSVRRRAPFSTRSPSSPRRRWSGRGSAMRLRRLARAPRQSGFATSCWRRSVTISARRWPRCWVRRQA